MLTDLPAVPERFAPHVKWAKGLKELLVAQAKPGQIDDLAPVIEVSRNDVTVAFVHAKQVDRDLGLHAAQIAVPGYSSDSFMAVFDTHMSDERFVKKYGRTPDPHELQHLCDTEQACEIGLITDAVFLALGERGKGITYVTVPYHVHHSTDTEPGRVHWNEEGAHAILPGDARVEGLVSRALEEALARPTVREAMPAGEFGITEEEAQQRADVTVTQLLANMGYEVMFALAPENYDEMTSRLLAEGSGVALKDMDGNVRAAPGLPDELATMGKVAGLRVEIEAMERHQAELDEAERRRLEREQS